MAEAADSVETPETAGFLSSLFMEIIQSPLNIGLVLIIAFLVYKIFKSHESTAPVSVPAPPEPKFRRDFTVQELRQFDGSGPDARILLAINGTVYNVTKGSVFYGPGGPYSVYAGRDASRGLATFSFDCLKDEYDDLSDLTAEEMEGVLEWQAQFKDKYPIVGRVLKPGEEHRNYSDEEDEAAAANKSKDE